MADPLRSPQLETGQREMAFCHVCQDEWPTSEYGLTCPQCESEFTEIMENNDNPLEAAAHEPAPFLHDHDHGHDHGHGHGHGYGHDHDYDPYTHYESMRTGRDGRNTLDYTSGLLSDSHFVRTRLVFGPGDRRPSTSPFPRQQHPPSAAERHGPPGGPAEMMQVLENIIGRDFARGGLGPRRSSSSRSTSGDGAADWSRNDDTGNAGPSQQGRNRPHAEAYGITMEFGGGEPPRFGSGRFVHNPNARLSPRDANQAQPGIEPVDALHTIIGGLFQQMHPVGVPGHRGSPGPDDIPNAFTAILASLLNPGVAGDAVYTQEALDRVISQLMEQHTGGNAPGPAPEEAIAALPKKKVDRSMLDNKDEGDCSVCMDSVSVGSEVTNLPCGHWFHEHCVSMWLREHNTCPICRKGITSNGEETQQQPRSPAATINTAERQIPRSEGEGSGAGIGGRVRQWFSGTG